MIEYTKEIQIRGTNNGYLYFIDKEHPLSTGNSHRIYLHRHLASIKLGRWLNKEDQVHHIDNNAKNNASDNLLVCTASEHTRIHKGIITKNYVYFVI